MEHKIAIITGSSSGIGKSCALELLKQKCVVIGIDKEESTIENTKYTHYVADITNESIIIEIIEKVDSENSKIDYLVNAAGTFSNNKPFYDLDIDQWNKVISINLTGTFIISKHVAKKMIKNSRGKIVNISCIRSGIYKSNMCDYASSKAAVVALTSTMALDLAKYNIQVNSVAPGFTYTGMTQNAFDQPEIRKSSEALIPNGKIAMPEDISPVVMFLLSESSDYVTGTTIYADGGYRIQK
jgi:NAD(P)-dependent dehydrogenase (short-subunit alcohol dehydrogenase family)